MNIVASVTHELPGRTRLKIYSRRGNTEYFRGIGQRLSGCPGVIWLRANPRTASLLIGHAVPFSQIAAFAKEQELFLLAANKVNRRRRSPYRQVVENLEQVNVRFTRFTHGQWDTRSVLLIAILGLSVVQTARGQILVPAMALWFQALDLLVKNIKHLDSEPE
jgi:hypothetical protein